MDTRPAATTFDVKTQTTSDVKTQTIFGVKTQTIFDTRSLGAPPGPDI